MRLIDADALLEELWRIRWNLQMMDDTQTADKMMAGLRKAEEKIEAAPTIDLMRWTPVSERLPKEDEDVLITYRYKEGEGDTSHMEIDITSYGYMYFGGNAVHDFDGKRIKHWRQPFAYFTQNYEVVAWMPLPEPWKGEE